MNGPRSPQKRLVLVVLHTVLYIYYLKLHRSKCDMYQQQNLISKTANSLFSTDLSLSNAIYTKYIDLKICCADNIIDELAE